MSNGRLDALDSLKTRVIPVDQLRTEDAGDEGRAADCDALIVRCDFADESVLASVAREMYDVIFHLASTTRIDDSFKHPVATTNNNLMKTVELFTAAIEKVDRIVFASSAAVYGEPSELPTPVTAAKCPRSPYALQKAVAEDYARLYGQIYGLDVVCLRYFNVYGPGQRGDSPYATAVAAWCSAIQGGRPLRSDGDGTQCRDMVHVEDVVDANLLAATSRLNFKGHAFNVGTGKMVANREILDSLMEEFPDILVVDAPWRVGDVMRTCADISVSERELGFRPRIQFAAGLHQTLRWWKLVGEAG